MIGHQNTVHPFQMRVQIITVCFFSIPHFKLIVADDNHFLHQFRLCNCRTAKLFAYASSGFRCLSFSIHRQYRFIRSIVVTIITSSWYKLMLNALSLHPENGFAENHFLSKHCAPAH